jgi:hypothetical protein
MISSGGVNTSYGVVEDARFKNIPRVAYRSSMGRYNMVEVLDVSGSAAELADARTSATATANSLLIMKPMDVQTDLRWLSTNKVGALNGSSVACAKGCKMANAHLRIGNREQRDGWRENGVQRSRERSLLRRTCPPPRQLFHCFTPPTNEVTSTETRYQ